MPPKKKIDTPPSTKIVNLYENKKVQKHMDKSINPYFNVHHIKVPFRAIMIGSSGSGKTNCLLNLINIMPKTFNKIYIYTKAREPIYDYLREELGDDLLSISYDLNDLRNFDEKKYYGQSLVVFDDMINERDQRCIQELYIRGRKLGVSMIYLSQSYYQIPKTVRLQCQYIFILKVSGVRDLKMMMSEYSLGASKNQLTNLYNYCCNSGHFGNFLLIDLEAAQSKTYRKNWDEYLNPNDFS